MRSLPRYLLDVNALVAFGIVHHTFHDRMVAWIQARQFASLATCSITELGFVRVLAQTASYGLDVDGARALLPQLKNTPGLAITFINDDQDVTGLPVWVKTGRQTTDGHLMQLAQAHSVMLATLDGKIPGSFLIP
jgi:predicted nucleic acid-binding protein